MQTLVKNVKRTRYSRNTRAFPDFLNLGQDYVWDAKNCPGDGGFLRSTFTINKSQDSLGLLQIGSLKHWLAVGAYHSPYWNGVCYGKNYSEVPKHTHFFLWERLDGSYGILLPLLAGDYVITVRGNGRGIKLHADGGKAEPVKANTIVAYSATGRDIYRLVNESMHAVAGKFKSFRLRQEKRTPAFADYLGWCTWNACYHDVNAEKILKGVASLKNGGITPGFVLLDDGWQDVRQDKLNSFGINPERFPGGFKKLTAKLKQQYDIKFFGVWHAFQGYWLGVHPQGKLAEKFRLFKERGIIRPWVNGGKKNETVYVVHPRQARQFFSEYHRALKREGVEMLKVDVQSGLNEFTEDHFGRASAMQLYQRALQHSAMNHFKGNMIHCMSNTLDVAYNMNRTLVWRNTDDFIPKLKSGGQQEHIRANAINNLLTGTFALPDWDMFQSHHRYAEFHAAARALSGGPVYISDRTGHENFEVIRKVASADGRVWRCDRPALPCADTIFVDSRKSAALLKIHNRAGNIGLLGLFHCSDKSGKIGGIFSPGDVPDVRGREFVADYQVSGRLEKLSRDEQSGVVLPRMGFEIVTLSPIIKSWLAPLGRTGRYVGATSLKQVIVHEDVAEISVHESGEYRIWCAAKPAAIQVDGQVMPVDYDAGKQLLKVELPVAGKIEIMR
ncbi:MAG: alpha-galactosidase [Verrucomicrobiales bacterium]|jgi:raffinose synthase|nr:alpha-galactosidase [Verrucomicrobiales bacterium]